MIDGVVVVPLTVHSDSRGSFIETYRQEWTGSKQAMVQANRADRQAGTLVGLHYHIHQADYWYVSAGKARAVLHDLRIGSPTEGETMDVPLNPESFGLYIPPGVAHGFYAITDMTITYMVTQYYNPEDELGVAWNDPEWVWYWPTLAVTLSDRDQKNPLKSNLTILPYF